MFAMFLYLTLYIQNVLGYSPLEAGLRFLPITLLAFVVAPIAAKLSERVPAAAAMGVGLTLVGVGLLLMRGLRSADWTALLPGFIVAGVGIGMMNPDRLHGDRRRRAGAAGWRSGINTHFRQVGIATGIAALGAVFQSRVDSKLTELVPLAPDALRRR